MFQTDGFQDSNSKPRKLSPLAEGLVRSECVSPVYLLKKDGNIFRKFLEKDLTRFIDRVKLVGTTMWELI